jgi:hypothetical protein
MAESVYQNKSPVAHECILTWCVKIIQSSYTWGNYEETLTEAFINITGRENPTLWNITPFVVDGEDSNWITFDHNYSIYPPHMDSTTSGFRVSNDPHTKTPSLFEDMFPSTITVVHRTGRPIWRIQISR